MVGWCARASVTQQLRRNTRKKWTKKSVRDDVGRVFAFCTDRKSNKKLVRLIANSWARNALSISLCRNRFFSLWNWLNLTLFCSFPFNHDRFEFFFSFQVSVATGSMAISFFEFEKHYWFFFSAIAIVDTPTECDEHVGKKVALKEKKHTAFSHNFFFFLIVFIFLFICDKICFNSIDWCDLNGVFFHHHRAAWNGHLHTFITLFMDGIRRNIWTKKRINKTPWCWWEEKNWRLIKCCHLWLAHRTAMCVVSRTQTQSRWSYFS